MSAFETNYTVFVLLAEAGGRPLYSWDVWRHAAPLLDPIVAAARGDMPAVWATCCHGGGGYGDYGKVGWNERGHQKWPVGAPRVEPGAGGADFGSFKVWKPSWPTSEKEGVGPDVHVDLLNTVPFGHRVPGFDYGFLLALSENLPPAARRAAPAAVREIAAMIRPTIAATTKRPWAVDPADVLYPGPVRGGGAGSKMRARPKPASDARLDGYLASLAHSYWQHQRADARPVPAHLGAGWEAFR